MKLGILVFVLAGLGIACGGGSSSPDALAIVFSDETLRRRAQAAPALLEEAEAALALEERARGTDPRAAADYATEARLLFLAAAADGERRMIERRADEGPGPLVEDREARRYALAVALASDQAERAAESATEFEAARWRSRRETLTTNRRDAIAVVVARTRILLAAVQALDATEASGVEALTAQLDELAARRDPSEALHGVDELRGALEGRLAQPSAAGLEVVQAARRAGLSAEPIDSLWAIDLGALSALGEPEDIQAAVNLLERLDKPRFLLVIEGPKGASLGRAAEAVRRRSIEAGVDESKMVVVVAPGASASGLRASLRLLGYPSS